LDNICDSPNFVVVGIYWWLSGWWTHSYPAGHGMGEVKQKTRANDAAPFKIFWLLCRRNDETGDFLRNRDFISLVSA